MLFYRYMEPPVAENRVYTAVPPSAHRIQLLKLKKGQERCKWPHTPSPSLQRTLADPKCRNVRLDDPVQR